MAWFHLYLRWYVGRHFHGLRIAGADRFPRCVNGPTIIYLNHPSWWDPLTCILLSRHFLPQSNHYAPMDAAALRRYQFLSKLGLFPVEPDTLQGGIQFMRRGKDILRRPNSVLWLTPEGRFVDPRKRLVFKDGLAHLLQRVGSATLLPLAIEYVFWDERLPEILVNCGIPLPVRVSGETSATALNGMLISSLAMAQEELAVMALSRDATKFETLLEGGAGVGVMYDLWRRMNAQVRGERYGAEHGSIRPL
jgi:1-acyl-sn-glycerol-3-phosphate acyltransferase